MSDAIREALGGQTSEAPPVEELWGRVSAAVAAAPPRRRVPRWFVPVVAVAAAILLIVIRRDTVSDVGSVQLATTTSLRSIDRAMAALRPDSAANPRVADEVMFLARLRASLQTDFPTTPR